MKALLQLLILVFVTSFVQAQINYSPSPFVISEPNREPIDENDTLGWDIEKELLLSHSFSEDKVLYWKVRKDRFPQEWESSICDLFTCYQPNVDMSSKNHGNNMQTDTVYHWSVHLNPWYTAGYDTIYLELYDDKDFLNQVGSIPIILDIWMTATTELNFKEINIYPNPSSNYIQLEGDEDVSSLVFFDIVGKEIKRESHEFGEKHIISNLQNGVYLLQLIDDNNNIIGVSKMIKE